MLTDNPTFPTKHQQRAPFAIDSLSYPGEILPSVYNMASINPETPAGRYPSTFATPLAHRTDIVDSIPYLTISVLRTGIATIRSTASLHPSNNCTHSRFFTSFTVLESQWLDSTGVNQTNESCTRRSAPQSHRRIGPCSNSLENTGFVYSFRFRIWWT